jgi:hypothetical protein
MLLANNPKEALGVLRACLTPGTPQAKAALSLRREVVDILVGGDVVRGSAMVRYGQCAGVDLDDCYDKAQAAYRLYGARPLVEHVASLRSTDPARAELDLRDRAKRLGEAEDVRAAMARAWDLVRAFTELGVAVWGLSDLSWMREDAPPEEFDRGLADYAEKHWDLLLPWPSWPT